MMKMLMYILFLIPLINLGWITLFFYLVIGSFIWLNSSFLMNYLTMVSYSWGGDILSWVMVLLSLWILSLMLLSSSGVFNKGAYSSEFLAVNLFLLIMLFLTFMTFNLFMFYLFFEGSLIPTMLLIFGWGYQPERLSAGYYLLFYTLVASLPMLISIFYIFKYLGTLNFFLIGMPINIYLYVSLLLAFLVKMPMVFLHFWLPSAHVEAPISGSMILAGVLLKLGGYGIMRVMMFIYSKISMSYFLISLSMVGSLLISLVCLLQSDVKSLIAYSSVSHMGLVLGGIITNNYWGLMGALILMVGHGLCSSSLFCLANIVYECTHSRSILINSGMLLIMPSLSFFWFFNCVNNMSSPPTLNLMGELMLVNSLIGWDSLSLLYMFIALFLTCCYSIYLFSITQHGSLMDGLLIAHYNTIREFMLIFLHLLPLNMIFLKSDIFMMWFV